MTQSELASAIEQGFSQPNVVERRLVFLQTEAEGGETQCRCCLLGAALLGHFGLAGILQLKAKYPIGSEYLDFVTDQLKITRTLARAIEWDYSQLNLPRNYVLTKLRSNQYEE